MAQKKIQRRLVKKRLLEVLKKEKLEDIFKCLEEYRSKDLLNPLFSALCHNQERVRWHAVSCFGKVVNDIALENMEDARVIMRRFLWMLNDESGGIGWGVPESMAEVMVTNHVLAEEYSHMLVSYIIDDGPELFQDGNFLELELLQHGVLWGLCRLAEKDSQLILNHNISESLSRYFGSQDSQVRGSVCRLSGLVADKNQKHLLVSCQLDKGRTRWYENGYFLDYTVGQLAVQALERIDTAPGGTY